MATKSINKTETPFEKRQRLMKRKQRFRATYNKGTIFEDKEKLIEWIKQNDVIIKTQAGGVLDDETEFIQVSIEGYNPEPF